MRRDRPALRGLASLVRLDRRELKDLQVSPVLPVLLVQAKGRKDPLASPVQPVPRGRLVNRDRPVSLVRKGSRATRDRLESLARLDLRAQLVPRVAPVSPARLVPVAPLAKSDQPDPRVRRDRRA